MYLHTENMTVRMKYKTRHYPKTTHSIIEIHYNGQESHIKWSYSMGGFCMIYQKKAYFNSPNYAIVYLVQFFVQILQISCWRIQSKHQINQLSTNPLIRYQYDIQSVLSFSELNILTLRVEIVNLSFMPKFKHNWTTCWFVLQCTSQT